MNKQLNKDLQRIIDINQNDEKGNNALLISSDYDKKITKFLLESFSEAINTIRKITTTF